MEFIKKFGEKCTGKEISEIVKKGIEIKEKMK